MDIQWEDPPSPEHRGRKPISYPLLDALRDHPGRWAVMATFANPRQAQQRTVYLKKRYLGYDFVTRKNVVYVRYNPQETTP